MALHGGQLFDPWQLGRGARVIALHRYRDERLLAIWAGNNNIPKPEAEGCNLERHVFAMIGVALGR